MSDVLAGTRRGPRSYLLFVGPAVIASIAYMDPGNYATNIRAGAGYGYGLLWVVLMANLIAMLFQALSANLGIVTGRNLAELCRDRFPRPLVLAMWVISEIAATTQAIAHATPRPVPIDSRLRTVSVRAAFPPERTKSCRMPASGIWNFRDSRLAATGSFAIGGWAAGN